MSEEQETEAFVEEPNKKGALKEEYELPSIYNAVLTANVPVFFLLCFCSYNTSSLKRHYLLGKNMAGWPSPESSGEQS